ncbi:MAG: hypothetical protein G01um101448_1206, partial [Parcubacteria group bacterium Gr01-1014_48]
YSHFSIVGETAICLYTLPNALDFLLDLHYNVANVRILLCSLICKLLSFLNAFRKVFGKEGSLHIASECLGREALIIPLVKLFGEHMKILRVVGLALAIFLLKFILMWDVFRSMEGALISFFSTFSHMMNFLQASIHTTPF